MANERTVILRLDDDSAKQWTVATSFTAEDLEKACDVIYAGLSEDEQDIGCYEDLVIQHLEEKGYVKVLGPAPEIVDILLM